MTVQTCVEFVSEVASLAAHTTASVALAPDVRIFAVQRCPAACSQLDFCSISVVLDYEEVENKAANLWPLSDLVRSPAAPVLLVAFVVGPACVCPFQQALEGLKLVQGPEVPLCVAIVVLEEAVVVV